MGLDIVDLNKRINETPSVIKNNLTLFCDALARSIELQYRSDVNDPTLLRDAVYKCATTDDGRNMTDLRKQANRAVETLKGIYPQTERPLLFIQEAVASAGSLIGLIHGFKNVESFKWAAVQEEATKKSIGEVTNPLNEHFLLGIVSARVYENNWIQTLVKTPDLFTLEERRKFLLDEIGTQGKSLVAELDQAGMNLEAINKMSIDELMIRIVWSTLSLSGVDQKALPKSEA